MSYTDLRQSPAYQRALQTPSIIFKRADSPSKWLGRRFDASYVGNYLWVDRQYHPRDAGNYGIESTGYRLDHMLRRVLDPANDYYFPKRDLLSAIKTFIEMIDEWVPRVSVSSQARAFIEPRLQLCRAIIARADRPLAEWGYPPVSSDAFRHFVTVSYGNAREFRGARYDDGTIRDPVFRTVFDNPFARNDFFLPFRASSEACTFMVHIQLWFWN